MEGIESRNGFLRNVLSVARIAQAVERIIGNDEVPGSTPGVSTRLWRTGHTVKMKMFI